jgi:hypothetical protein
MRPAKVTRLIITSRHQIYGLKTRMEASVVWPSEYILISQSHYSKSQNSPFIGRRFPGLVSSFFDQVLAADFLDPGYLDWFNPHTTKSTLSCDTTWLYQKSDIFCMLFQLTDLGLIRMNLQLFVSLSVIVCLLSRIYRFNTSCFLLRLLHTTLQSGSYRWVAYG